MNGWVSACISSPVYTATTPGSRRASSTSIPRMTVWANGLRTKCACSMPGTVTSSTYRPVPVSRRGSSTRATLVPTNRPAMASRMATV